MNRCLAALVVSVGPLSLGSLAAASLTYSNTSNPKISPEFVVGDDWSLSITGAANDAEVTAATSHNGIPTNGGQPFKIGMTDNNGHFFTSGFEGSAEIGNWTDTIFVNGVQVGPVLLFSVIDKPTGLKVISDPVVGTAPNNPNGGCGTTYYGIFVDVKYQITGASGNINPTLSDLFEPYETGVFPNGVPYSSDVGPALGYNDSSQYASSNGTFHDVPLGECDTGEIIVQDKTTQTIYMDLGSRTGTNGYKVRSQTLTVTSVSLGSGTISNGSDINKSR